MTGSEILGFISKLFGISKPIFDVLTRHQAHHQRYPRHTIIAVPEHTHNPLWWALYVSP